MIRIEALTRRYAERTVVNRVSLEVPRGSIAVVVGGSGSGKSTLLRMINRLVEPSEGRVFIDGRDTRELPAHQLRRRIGYVIQGHGLFPHRTVADNIGTVPRLLGWPAARIAERTHELLATFGLEPSEYGRKYPHELSGGQQQRVGVARALAAEPAVLLMDEPFGALDPIIRAKAQEDLLEVQRRLQLTIVLVTHDMDEAFHLGSRIAVMSDGRLLQYATPVEILAAPADPFVERMMGSGDRALRLLSLLPLGSLVVPGPGAGSTGAPLRVTANLREALAELVWRGAEVIDVADEGDRVIGHVTLAALLERGRGGAA